MSERVRPSDATFRRLALASLVVLTAIVLTGAVVRLTDSGLGCDWPRCTTTSVLPQGELPEGPVKAAIEFGNRLLSVVVGLVVLATAVGAWRRRRSHPRELRLTAALFAGVLAQGILGGITVRTGLHPLTVAAHFLLSMVLLVAAVALVERTRPSGDMSVHRLLRRLAQVLLGVLAVTLVLGTLVTGSGPHSGDPDAERLPFDPAQISQLHADSVMLFLGLLIALVVALRATDAGAAAQRRSGELLAVALGQGLVGYVQYFTDLPIVLVAAHVLGACLVWIFALRLVLPLQVAAGADLPARPQPRPELVDA